MAGTLNKGSLVKGTGGSGGGGGSASFPTVVTDSGSSLPSASGYQLNDTFLNTSDKKIYKTEVNGYVANTNTTLTVNVDYATGIASGFANSLECIRSGLTNQWYGTSEVNHSVKFKISSVQTSPVIVFSAGGGGSYNYAMFYVSNEGKIFHKKYTNSYGSVTVQFDNQILDTVVIADKIYILNITKEGTGCIAQLTNESGTILEEKNFTTEDLSSGTNSVFYGTGRIGSSNVYSSNLSVYLGQSAGELVIPNTSTLSWDTGTDLTDKTEYADKTNGALYLYENSELVKIGSSAPTVLTDQTATSMALAGNTIYKWTSALTSLSFASVEVSDLETVLYFTTGGTISFTDSSNLNWGGDGTAPSLEANTIYCISIRNGLAEIDTFGTVS